MSRLGQFSLWARVRLLLDFMSFRKSPFFSNFFSNEVPA